WPSMTPSASSDQALLEQICVLAEKAGRRAMHFYDGRTSVTWKADSSPLTEADRASHDLILEALSGLMAGVPVVSEESDEASRGAGVEAARFWLVDPLDGTKEFLKGTGEFTVNIALVEAGRAVLGVVHAPALGRTFFADSTGAFRRDEKQGPTPIRVQSANR